MSKIESVEHLRRVYKPALGRSVEKQLDHLDPHCRKFLSLAPFLVIGTQGIENLGDVAPRGDHPGFVAVPDANTVLIPDRPGNNRLDNYTNILENPKVSLVFLIPGVNETLRINGIAEIRDDADLLEMFSVGGKLPITVLKVTVREAYLHCAKALMRSRLWSPEAQVERSVLPSMGQMIKDQTKAEEPPEGQAEMEARYEKVLY